MNVKPCVGCGYCCMKTPCDVSRRLYPNATVCPQLIWTDVRYECGLMKISGPLGEDYRKELHAGAGCCCGLNSWRQDVKKRVPELQRTNYNPLPEVMQVFIKNLGRQFISGDVIHLTLAAFQVDMVEKGYEPDEVNYLVKNIYHAFDNQRSSFTKGFIG